MKMKAQSWCAPPIPFPSLFSSLFFYVFSCVMAANRRGRSEDHPWRRPRKDSWKALSLSLWRLDFYFWKYFYYQISDEDHYVEKIVIIYNNGNAKSATELKVLLLPSPRRRRRRATATAIKHGYCTDECIRIGCLLWHALLALTVQWRIDPAHWASLPLSPSHPSQVPPISRLKTLQDTWAVVSRRQHQLQRAHTHTAVLTRSHLNQKVSSLN